MPAKQILRRVTALLFSAVAFAAIAADANRAIVIRTAMVKAEPSFGADTVTTLTVGASVSLGERKGGWQQIRVLPAAEQVGWLRSYQVRADIQTSKSVVARRTSERGVLSGLSGLSQRTFSLFGQREMEGSDGDITATMGVRGLSEEDFENLRPDAVELEKFKQFSIGSDVATKYAQAGGLEAKQVKELPKPKKYKKKKKKKSKKKKSKEKKDAKSEGGAS